MLICAGRWRLVYPSSLCHLPGYGVFQITNRGWRVLNGIVLTKNTIDLFAKTLASVKIVMCIPTHTLFLNGSGGFLSILCILKRTGSRGGKGGNVMYKNYLSTLSFDTILVNQSRTKHLRALGIPFWFETRLTKKNIKVRRRQV